MKRFSIQAGRLWQSPRSKALTGAILVVGAALLLWWRVGLWYHAYEMKQRRVHTEQIARPYSNAVTTALNRRLALLDSLHAFVLSQITFPETILQANFNRFAASLYDDTNGIHCIAAAPEGIQRYIYPPDSPDAAPGTNVLSSRDAVLQAAIQQAIASGETVLSRIPGQPDCTGGITAWRAVSADDGSFWGLVSITLDVPALLEDAGIGETVGGLQMALRDENGDIVFGDAAVFDSNPIISMLALPGTTWELAAVPVAGWEPSITPEIVGLHILALFSTLMMGALAYLLINRQAQLAQRVKERTQEIAEINAQLEAGFTRRKKLETSLQESEARFRGAFTHSQIGLALVSPDGRLTQVNPALCEILGYSAEELLETDFLSLLEPEDQHVAQNLLHSVLSEQKPHSSLEQRFRHKNGDLIWGLLTLSTVRDAEGRPQYIVLQLIDQTPQRLMEEILWEQSLRSEMIFQVAINGFCVLDAEGKILDANDAFSTIVGCPIPELNQTPITQLRITPPGKMQAALAEALAEGSATFEATCHSTDDRTANVLVTISRIAIAEDMILFLSIHDITERKQVERELRQLSRAVEQSPASVVITDTDGSIEYVNPRFTEITGYTLEEVLGRNPRILKSGHTPPEEYERLWKTITAGREWRGELLNRKKSGELYWEHASISPITDSEGNITHFLAVKEDITARKEAEAALQESEERFRMVTESSLVGVYIIQDGLIRYANPALAETFGYTPEEIIDRMRPEDIVHPDDHAQMQENIRRRIEGEIEVSHYVMRGVRKDGTDIDIEVLGRRATYQGRPAVVGTLLDITERKRAEEALRESEHKFRSLVEQSADGIVLTDEQGIVIEWNQSQEQITGIPRAEAVGQPIWEIQFRFLPEELRTPERRLRIEKTIRDFLTSGEAPWMGKIQEHEIQLPNGERRVIQTVTFPIQTARGYMMGSITRDITGRKQAEEALRVLNLDLENRNRELLALHEIGQMLAATLDVRQAYRVMYQEVGQRLLQVPHFVIALYDTETEMITCGYAIIDGEEADPARFPPLPLGEGPTSDTIRTRKPRIVDLDKIGPPLAKKGRLILIPGKDVDKGDDRIPRSALYVPMLSGDRVIGVMNVQSYEANAFNTTSIPLLSILANQAAIAIQNARLFTAEHEQRALAEALRDTIAVLTRSLDLNTVLNGILENVGRVVPHDAANIMLVENDILRPVQWHGYAKKIDDTFMQELRLPLTDLPSFRWMFQTGQPCLISNTEEGVDAIEWDSSWPEVAWIRSYVGVPILAHGQVIGFINLDSRQPGFFTQRHVERLQAFADQAAIAIENAQLYDELRRHAAEMEHHVALRTRELEEERAQLQAILDSMGEGVIYTEGTSIRYVNWLVPLMTGYTRDELNHLLWEALPELLAGTRDSCTDPGKDILTALDTHAAWHGEVRLRRKDGSEFDASLTVTLVSPPGEEPVCTVTLIRDISQQKALEAQKDRFIASASHELRTPLANMKMRLYLLRKQPEKFEKHMDVLQEVTDTMEKLVEDLLDVSRFERGVITLNRRTTILQDLIRKVVESLLPRAESEEKTLSCILPETPIKAFVDPDRVSQVITNLTTNALNYTPEGGQITIELAEDIADTALIHVRDTGIGIPPELQSQIFEPFFRADENAVRGTGLGLTISREIITSHGGEIMLESEPGRGSTFTVRLPLMMNSSAEDGT